MVLSQSCACKINFVYLFLKPENNPEMRKICVFLCRRSMPEDHEISYVWGICGFHTQLVRADSYLPLCLEIFPAVLRGTVWHAKDRTQVRLVKKGKCPTFWTIPPPQQIRFFCQLF